MANEPNATSRFAPRYSEIPTFMRAPLIRAPSKLDIALVGVPFDAGA